MGTPHLSPDSALVDQTRGLLQEIADAETCSPKHLFNRGIQVTCVGSAGVNGTFLTTNLEEIIAAASYLTLMGSMTKQSCGDGIVPFDLAFMEEPARRVAIAQSSNGRPVRHAGFFPTPWNLWDGYSESIRLPEDYKWYGSKDVIDQWAPFIY